MILPAKCLPLFRGLPGIDSYKNKPLSLKKAACPPPKRLSRTLTHQNLFPEKEAFGTNPSYPFASLTFSIPTNLRRLEM
jgi:hypothetical protein